MFHEKSRDFTRRSLFPEKSESRANLTATTGKGPFPLQTTIKNDKDRLTMSLLSHLLFETAGGYAIFKVQAQTDELATATQAYENSFDNLHLFGKLVQLLSFTPFADAAQVYIILL